MNHTGVDPHGTAFSVQGEGAPVLLVHGVGLDARIWDPMVPALARHHRVITYDMLGHGGSALPGPEVRLRDYALQACQLLDHLGIQSCAAVGFSMGALVVEEMAVGHADRVDRLAAISGVYDRPIEQKLGARTRALEIAVRGIAPMIEPALERWLTPAFRAANPELIRTLASRMLGNDPVGYLRSQAVFATGDDDLVGRVDTIRCPTLIITGEFDSGSTPDMSVRLGQHIAGSQVVILPGLRHLLTMEAPDLLLQHLEPFLRSGTTEGNA